MDTAQNIDVFSMTPGELAEWLHSQFAIDIPISVETIDELQTAGTLLGVCASNYAYLINMAMMAKLRKRNLKSSKASKNQVEDALSREELFTTYADISKTSYNAISRMITVRAQIAEEIKMSKYTT